MEVEVWERPGPGNIHHGSTSGTQGGHWGGKRSSTHHAALYSRTLYGSHAWVIATCSLGFRVLNEVKVVESKLQECHIHLDREKATQKEKGVMSGVVEPVCHTCIITFFRPFRI